MNREEKTFPYSRMPTKKCRRNDEITKSSFGNHHSNNSFKKHQWILKSPLLLNETSISFQWMKYEWDTDILTHNICPKKHLLITEKKSSRYYS